MEDILDSPLSEDSDKIKVTFGMMDRAGLPPGKTLTVDATFSAKPPAEMLEDVLSAVRERMAAGGVVVGEVVPPMPVALQGVTEDTPGAD